MDALFFLKRSGHHQDLHSFPTRRSSDLRTTDGRGGRARHILVAVEVAMATVLLIGAGLLIRSVAGLLNVPVGFETRSEEHTSELQSQSNLVCRLLLEKKKRLLSAAAAPG